jgi:hypothetical protein
MSKSPLNFGMFGAATIASGMTGAGGGLASALRGKRPKTLKEMMRGEPTMQDLSNKLDEISSKYRFWKFFTYCSFIWTSSWRL